MSDRLQLLQAITGNQYKNIIIGRKLIAYHSPTQKWNRQPTPPTSCLFLQNPGPDALLPTARGLAWWGQLALV